MIDKLFHRFILLAAGAIIIFATGCGGEKKDESPQAGNEIPQEQNQQMDTTSQPTDTTTLGKEAETIPDITGTWTGELNAHTSVLKITKQDSLSFKGRISTEFRQQVNQEVAGKFDPDKNTLTMKDQIQNRYMGTYSAKFSNDMKTLEGSFYLIADKKTYNFRYTKK